MKIKLGLFSLLLIPTTIACSEPKTDTVVEGSKTEIDLSNLSLPEKVDALIEADQYEEALALLDKEEMTQDVLTLKEKTHLNYGIYIIYNSDPSKMRENANNGLRQFIKVLDINRDNDKAVSEIENIMGIYASMDRAPEEDVVEGLKRLGFDY